MASYPPPAVAGPSPLYAVNMTALLTLSTSGVAAGTSCVMAGYTNPGDGGGGTFVWYPTSSRYADGGVTVRPTAISSSNPGRWFRVIPEQDARINVLWFGANRFATGNTTNGGVDSTTAINNAILVCSTFKSSYVGTATSILKLYFPAGGYAFNFITGQYDAFEIVGDGYGTTRLYQNNGFYCPPIYFQGGGYTTTFPYGGCHGVEIIAGTNALGAIVYMDTSMDQGGNFDEVDYYGNANGTSTLPLDGFSAHDFLNAGMNRVRFDRIGGYGIVFRGYKANALSCTTSTGVHFSSTAINTTTGGITITGTMPLEPGTAVMWFNGTATSNTGSPPTATDTGTVLSTGDQGVCYFVALGSQMSGTSFILYLTRTRAQALAGTNILTYTSAGSGTSGLVVFRTNYDMQVVTSGTTGTATGTTSTQQVGYTNDKNVIVATSVPDTTVSSSSYNLCGTGFSSKITTNNGSSTNSCTHVVFFAAANGATLPPNLSAGVAYYPCYIDGQTFSVYSTPAYAAASGTSSTPGYATAGLIDPTGGSGEIVVLYAAVTSIENCSHFTLDDFTYDNTNAQTYETIGTTACGGFGLLYADFMNFTTYKGSLSIRNSRIELNKPPARDPRTQSIVPNLFRIIGCNIITGALPSPNLGVFVENINPTLNSGTQRNVCFLGTTFGELAYNIKNLIYSGLVSVVENDCFNMVGSIQGQDEGDSGRVVEASNIGTFGVNAQVRQNNSSIMKWGGLQLAIANDMTNSILAPGDYAMNPAITGPAFYKSINSTPGYTYGSSSGTSTGLTVTSTSGSAVFTVANGVAFPPNFCPHTAISIATALDGTNALVGIVGSINNLVSPATFTLYSSTTGEPLAAGAAVTAVAVSYVPPVIAQVDAVALYDLSVTIPAIASGAMGTVNVTVSGAPLPVSSSNPSTVLLGAYTSLPTGLIPFGLVYSSTVIQIRFANLSGSSYAGGTITMSARVSQ